MAKHERDRDEGAQVPDTGESRSDDSAGPGGVKSSASSGVGTLLGALLGTRGQRAQEGHDDAFIDLSEVAGEPAAESIARENEVVADIAHEDDSPEQPVDYPIEEQLRAQIDSDEIRRRGGVLGTA